MKEIKNKFKCSPQIWNKFTDVGKALFNEFYEAFTWQENYPTGRGWDEANRSVICHNLACQTVWILEKKLLTKKNNMDAQTIVLIGIVAVLTILVIVDLKKRIK